MIRKHGDCICGSLILGIFTGGVLSEISGFMQETAGMIPINKLILPKFLLTKSNEENII